MINIIIYFINCKKVYIYDMLCIVCRILYDPAELIVWKPQL